ncbi:restriction endonuclease subunit S, partial [Macrococcoides caseolyticum]|uniref:restriction endonuclease subunit S n=1 Tax=Macrococcoides caseolyticum TaxID=69966 RepID=UPI001F409515
EEKDITNEIPFEIPSSWEWTQVKDIFNIKRGASPRPIKNYISHNDEGINWIKIGDTNNDNMYITSANEKLLNTSRNKLRLVCKGDLLLTNSMSFGKPYILQIDGAIHDGWLQLNPFSNVNIEYFYYLLLSDFTQIQFKKVASGTAVKNLNSTKVEKIFIPFPPLKEQLKISIILKRIRDI